MDQNTGIGLIFDPQGGHFSVLDLEIMRGVVQHEIRVGLDLNRVIRAVLQAR